MQYILDRLAEPSTAATVAAFLGLLTIELDAGSIEQIFSGIVSAVAGIRAIFAKERAS